MNRTIRDILFFGAGVSVGVCVMHTPVSYTHLEPAEEDKQLLCYEPFSNRYFHATEAELYDAFYQMNRDFSLNGEVSINNLYSYLGLDYLPEKDDVGWCSDYMINEWEYFWIDFVANKQTTDDGLEVYQVYAFQPPIPDYLDYEPDKER